MAMFFYKNFAFFTASAGYESDIGAKRCIHSHGRPVVDRLIIRMCMDQEKAIALI
jgi:hypothetical protein